LEKNGKSLIFQKIGAFWLVFAIFLATSVDKFVLYSTNNVGITGEVL
jgi:hypothetical protein